MTAEERKPLSLNERNARLLDSLSRSRNPKPRSEVRVRKVKIEGRRRLCKLSSADAESDDEKRLGSPPEEEGECGGGGESIRDILDDLTARMDCLSVEKPPPKPRAVPARPETKLEYESAASSLSSHSVHSSPDDKRVEIKKGGEAKEKTVSLFSVDDDVVGDEEEEDCVVLGSDRKNEKSKGIEIHIESDDGWPTDEETNISSQDEDEGRNDFTMLGSGSSKSMKFVLPYKIFKMLYPHQRDGLKWLWAIHCGDTGGILGDDMGLGKTMQVSAFLAGLFLSRLIKRVLIVAPKTLLGHWMKELNVVGLSEEIKDYSGPNAKLRQYELEHVLKEGGVLLTTYDIVRNNAKSLRADWFADGEGCEEDNLWDYTVLDEGHIIKNPKTQRSKSISDIPCAHRIIISGTPIQNNLKELWALFNFCCPDVLGDKDMFKLKYENPILRGNDKYASDREKYIGSTVAKELRERIKPYFLRRLKSEVFAEDDTKNPKLSKKCEMIVWLKLTTCQRQLYEAFLKSELVHASMEGSPLAALTILKKICDHPLILTKRAAEGVLEGMDSMLNREELGMVETMAMNLANMTGQDSLLQLDHNISCKIAFIMSLLEDLIEEGHIVLIFSQTRKMLNIIQEAITHEGYKFLRIDGTTKITEREKIVKEFQEGYGAPIFLLTSQVGGLGLTLTKADRVIVVDPAWNPSTDNQSVDRAYRIGQKNDVLVYRLMTCGTIEEKIYKMQVFKGGLFKSATEQKEQTRYFSQKDISELFSLPEQGFDVSLTQQQLQEEHGQQQNMEDYLVKHIDFLHTLGIAGVSHHSLLFSKTAVVPLVPDTNEAESKMKNRIIRNSQFVSSNGAEYAFNPKDDKFISRTYAPKFQASTSEDSPEVIQLKIQRLSQTLGNKALVARLPDSGEKIQKQISQLQSQLHDLSSPVSSEREGPEVVSIDDLTDDLKRVSV